MSDQDQVRPRQKPTIPPRTAVRQRSDEPEKPVRLARRESVAPPAAGTGIHLFEPENIDEFLRACRDDNSAIKKLTASACEQSSRNNRKVEDGVLIAAYMTAQIYRDDPAELQRLQTSSQARGRKYTLSKRGLLSAEIQEFSGSTFDRAIANRYARWLRQAYENKIEAKKIALLLHKNTPVSALNQALGINSQSGSSRRTSKKSVGIGDSLMKVFDDIPFNRNLSLYIKGYKSVLIRKVKNCGGEGYRIANGAGRYATKR